MYYVHVSIRFPLIKEVIVIASDAWAEGGDKKLFIANENCYPAAIRVLNTLLTVTVAVPMSPTHCTEDFTF
jgi:hypothetical protein